MKFFPPAVSLLCFFAVSGLAQQPAAQPRGRAEHVVVVVWDGMRPDFVTEENTPALFKMAHDGVFFKNNHSVYITSTEVNGTALATGVYPGRSHIVANKEYRPAINPLSAIPTEGRESIRKGDALGGWLGVPTLEELLHGAGRRTVIAGTKPVTLLHDRSDERTTDAAKNSTVIFSGKSIPESAADDAAQVLGAKFPDAIKFPNTAQDDWTARALTEFLWKDGVPQFSLLWMSDPDFSQHNTAPGSPVALAALKSCDANLARMLAALEAKGVRDKTDVFLVSDHGFSTAEKSVDVCAALTRAGFAAARSFKSPPKPGEIMVVGVGGSVLFYIVGHERATAQRLVDFLQRSDFAAAIFTREKMAGTFTLAEARLDSPDAPDVLISMQWSANANRYGVAGSLTMDGMGVTGMGTHSTLGKFDVHNTLIADGPDFMRGAADEMPTGNVDLAPTILWILGVPGRESMDGRVLAEAMPFFENQKIQPSRELTLKSERDDSGIRWRQYLKITRFGGRNYFDEAGGGKP
jgi:arylsulfatase A-like enzyme